MDFYQVTAKPMTKLGDLVRILKYPVQYSRQSDVLILICGSVVSSVILTEKLFPYHLTLVPTLLLGDPELIQYLLNIILNGSIANIIMNKIHTDPKVDIFSMRFRKIRHFQKNLTCETPNMWFMQDVARPHIGIHHHHHIFLSSPSPDIKKSDFICGIS